MSSQIFDWNKWLGLSGFREEEIFEKNKQNKTKHRERDGCV